jgi:signal transduction histidine kinase
MRNRVRTNRTRIRARILACFSGILFFSFLLVGIIFNITITQYIRLSATSQLNASFTAMAELGEALIQHQQHEDSDDILDDVTMAGALRLAHDIFSSNIFFVDEDYNLLLAGSHSVGMLQILQKVDEGQMYLGGWHNQRIQTDSRMYYVSTRFMPDMLQAGQNVYMVAYVDVTSPMQLAVSFNAILMILVCVIFAFAAVAVFFLSNSITRPIEKLSSFALSIGRGDFSPGYFEFKDRELDDLNSALNKSIKQLGAYDSEQKTFFQNASHELRTPLMAIKCYAEGIAFGLMEPAVASKTILTETDRLSELVTDLLYISRIDNITPAHATEKTDLNNLIHVCAERQQAMAEKAGLKFAFDFNEDVIHYNCVRELISRAIDNLISNAIRYAASTITLACHKKNGGVQIRVADDGSGIEPEVFSHVFERFFKGADGNFGIGLSIVKSIIQQHGGQISAQNIDGSGAEFIITLPA